MADLSSHGGTELYSEIDDYMEPTSPPVYQSHISEPQLASQELSQAQLTHSYLPHSPSQIHASEGGNIYRHEIPAGTSGGNVYRHQIDPPPPYTDFFHGQPQYPPPSGQWVAQPQPLNPQRFQTPSQSPVITDQPKPMQQFIISQPTAAASTSSGLAGCSLAMAIIAGCCCVSIFCAIPAIILAAIALGSTSDPEKARGYAKGSCCLTVISWVVTILFVIYLVVLLGNA